MKKSAKRRNLNNARNTGVYSTSLSNRCGDWRGCVDLFLVDHGQQKTDVSDLRKAIENNEKSLSEVKGELRHLPTSKEVADLRLLMTEMKGKTDVLNTNIGSLNHQVKLLIEKEVNKE